VASPEEQERVELFHFRSGEVLAVPRQRVAEVGVVVGVTVVVASPTPTEGGDGPSVVVVGLLLGVEHDVVLGCCGARINLKIVTGEGDGDGFLIGGPAAEKVKAE